ncbi:hypothetical protein BAY61_10310 [Prauserella marina]|uniref:TIGR03083 family protein n=1 Tax=Prauserella marina TaxID=530584 RepID=A0A222VN23_9PSEU|nr:maleylpyruvate isomerase family mycothiol-dependent enzyme [Prauserella marina]ASR35320.1 hypothetical protein BAY61_10310 [Prauserella marina]PWV84893.1 uncharacterized protein (TIGR03083 family) [Prauserella marina]SDC10208.1 TIGR03083 family protein [Prauserella marina]
MDVPTLVAALDEAGTTLADAAALAGLDAEVPSCPGWRVRDVLLHTGGVHRWATTFVATGRAEPLELVEPHDISDSLPGDTGLVAWFLEGHAALVGALRSAPESLECWTFLAAPNPLAHWARRQAHETTVHRVDVELASGTPTKVGTDLAADGIDELLTCFAVRSRKVSADPARIVRVTAADAGTHWTLRLTPGNRPTASKDEPGQPPDTVLRGSAEELYLALWNRAPLAPLHVEGDDAVVAEWPRLLRVRW